MSDVTDDRESLGPVHAMTVTKDGHLVVLFDSPESWETRVYDRNGNRTRSDTAMDRDSAIRWANGAVKQHGGPKGG